MRTQEDRPATVCPVARSVDIVGDKWTILVLRELYMGTARFEEMQIHTGATPQMLTSRLKALEADGLVERRPYNAKPLRHEYHLTQKGWDFYPVIYALRAWGKRGASRKTRGLQCILCTVHVAMTSAWPVSARTAQCLCSAQTWRLR